jgi:hypothetical protein
MKIHSNICKKECVTTIRIECNNNMKRIAKNNTTYNTDDDVVVSTEACI